MVSVELVASTCPTGHVPPLTRPESQWQTQSAEWLLPGRFGFFVFRIAINYDASDWFPGLDWFLEEDDYYVAGTFDKWDSVCYTLLRTSSPHDCCEIYRHVYTTLSDFGYRLSGQRTAPRDNFYLV